MLDAVFPKDLFLLVIYPDQWKTSYIKSLHKVIHQMIEALQLCNLLPFYLSQFFTQDFKSF